MCIIGFDGKPVVNKIPQRGNKSAQEWIETILFSVKVEISCNFSSCPSEYRF